MLRAEIKKLQIQIREPREIVFADVLLRRPKYVTFLYLSLKLDGNPLLLLLVWKEQCLSFTEHLLHASMISFNPTND